MHCKGAVVRSEVRERTSARPICSKSPTASTILSYQSVDPLWSYIYVQGCPRSFGIPMESIFFHPIHTGLCGPAYKFHQLRVFTRCSQYVFSIRTVPFWNNLPALIVNTSLVKGTFGRKLTVPVFLSTRITRSPSPTTHPFCPHDPTYKLTPTWLFWYTTALGRF